MELCTPPEDGKESPQLRNTVALKHPQEFGHVNTNIGVILGIQVLLEPCRHLSII